MVLYPNDVCVYPVQNIPNIAKPYKDLDFYKQIENGKSYVIERNKDDLLGKLGKMVNFWSPIKNERGKLIGVLGL